MIRPRSHIVLALLLARAAVPPVATAEEAVAIETVTVVGKRPEPLQQAAAAVSVISAAQLEAAVAFDLGDALYREPGVSVPRDPQRFGETGITVRGLGGNRVLVETDGVPAAKAFAIGSFSNTGREFADLELVSRIELLRGPASALYGSDAIAGVLSMTTLDPTDLLGSHGEASLRARVGYSGDDGSLLAGVTGAWRAAAVEGLVGYTHRSGGERDHAGGSPPPNPADRDSDALLARFVVPAGARSLRVTGSWNRERVRTDVDALELSGGRFANTTLLAGDDRAETKGLLVDQRLDGAAGLDYALWRAYWNETAIRQATHEERRAVPPALPPLGIEREFRYVESVAGVEATAGREISSAAGPHRLLGGFEYTESRVVESRDGLQTDLDTGASTNVILGESLPVRDFPISRVRQAGVYAQDEWRPGDGHWSVIPALRLDGYWLSPEVDAMYAADNPSGPPVSIDEVSLSPKLGIARRVGEDVTVYLQYAHGFRAPPFEDVNIGLDLPQFNVRAIPNPDLKPERSDSLELGLRFQGTRLRGSASAYASRYADFIESRVNIGTDPDTGATLFQSRNLASAEIRGIEASLEVELGPIADSPARYTAYVSAGWTTGEDTARNEPINSIDPPRGVVGLRYASASGRFGAGAELTVAGAKRDVDETAGPLYKPDGYSVLDLRLQWRLHPRVTANLGLFNVTDRRYYEWSAVRGRAPDDPLLPLYGEAGRYIAATLTAALD